MSTADVDPAAAIKAEQVIVQNVAKRGKFALIISIATKKIIYNARNLGNTFFASPCVKKPVSSAQPFPPPPAYDKAASGQQTASSSRTEAPCRRGIYEHQHRHKAGCSCACRSYWSGMPSN